ncbi:MAG: ABC transporter ATP-binding protein, partial [Verrucomicrobiales bacterium]
LEQVQEVCDRVGIIFRGKMVREGPLDRLLAIEDQTEVVLKNASPELLANIQKLVTDDESGDWVRSGRPRTTLERLFLRETTQGQEE